MTYEVVFSSQARKFLRRLDKLEVTRVIDKLRDVAKDPFRYLASYEGEFYKLRIGNLRALVNVKAEEKKILVRVLDKRGRIYK